ncbi:hypothetical protein FRB95_011199 [Tulasnella sp. JGI-2019a]|nr:hypothetical protein FRB95_011199 [Tulasnella sp. JGI-2019a]
MYGKRDAGFSHFTSGYARGQAEYVRVPFSNVNCLKIPAEISDEAALYLSDILHHTSASSTPASRKATSSAFGV